MRFFILLLIVGSVLSVGIEKEQPILGGKSKYTGNEESYQRAVGYAASNFRSEISKMIKVHATCKDGTG